jgi:outer membrane protein assembly factor BamB
MYTTTLLASCFAVMVAGTAAFAASPERFDWPQWQGPDRNAVSKERGLLQQWPKDGPPLAWKFKGIGGGYSAPSIAAARIFGMSNRGEDEFVWALSETDGKELWATRLGPALTEGMPQGKEGAGCTPTVDGDRIYVLGMSGDLACLHAEDGRILWRRSLTQDFGGLLPTWRYNESPLIDGDKVICTPGGMETTIVALDKLTGKTLWTSLVPEPAGASSPGPGGGRGGAPDLMQSQPVLAGLDVDRNKAISTTELDDAPAALEKLDKNTDGKLTEEEVRPEASGQRGGPGGRGGRGGVMRFMPFLAALDADRNNEIDGAEIKNAAVALRKLDANSDGKLTEAEVAPQFGGRRGGPPSGAAYASAIAIDFEGQRQYVQLTAKSLIGVAAADGKLLWRYDRAASQSGINCSSPLYQDGRVFAASAYGNGGGLVKLSKDASGLKAEEVWFSKNMENHHGGMLVIDGALYGSNGGNGGGYLVCLDFQTGDVLWNERDADKRRVTKGSVALADGRIYYRTEEGPIVLIEPSRKEYVERGRFAQPDRTDKPAWTHPVIANGKLYIRDQDTLFCYAVKAPGN